MLDYGCLNYRRVEGVQVMIYGVLSRPNFCMPPTSPAPAALPPPPKKYPVKYTIRGAIMAVPSLVLMQGKGKGNFEVFQQLQKQGRLFHVSMPRKCSKNVQGTAGGLLFLRRWNNLQFATSAAFLMLVYADNFLLLGKNCSVASLLIIPRFVALKVILPCNLLVRGSASFDKGMSSSLLIICEIVCAAYVTSMYTYMCSYKNNSNFGFDVHVTSFG